MKEWIKSRNRREIYLKRDHLKWFLYTNRESNSLFAAIRSKCPMLCNTAM